MISPVTVEKNLPKGLDIAFSGVSFGNMDERFGDSAVLNQKKLYAHLRLKPSQVVIMDAKGEDILIDLTKIGMTDGQVTADALVTTSVETGLVLMPADCVPLVFYSAKPRCLALVHLGWRGTQLGLLQKVLDYICNVYGLKIEDCYAYFGPSIQKKSYYFSEIQPSQLYDPLWRKHITQIKDMYYIDLPSFIQEQLERIDWKPGNILRTSYDTGEGKDFFSNFHHNKFDTQAGRNGFVVKLRGEAFFDEVGNLARGHIGL